MFEIKVYNEVDELLEHLAEQLMAYSLRSKPYHIALSGGSTPKALYALLAMEPFNSAICWDNLHFWWGDE
ncbi:6-phosphogluconolactonase, partial [Oleiphilus sp. HI0066]|uniref:6-phosphogluconolactonase n=2 Tax=Oleiphilus TaxID=141450 RepID=UPI000A6EB6A2